MAILAKVDLVVNRILEILAGRPYERITPAELVKTIMPELGGLKGDYHVDYPLQSLCASGLVKFASAGRKVAWVQHNPEGGKKEWSTEQGSGDMIPKAELVKVMEAVKRQYDAKQSELKAELVKALDLVQEAKSHMAADRTVKVEVTYRDGSSAEFEETFHSCFEEMMQLAVCRENIFLYGPTGSGKTFIGQQLARVLGLEFYFLSCSSGMSEGHLTGRLLPLGKGGQFQYTPSEFVKAYEEGGVFLLDEFDAADPNVLLIINAALSNGRMAIPARVNNPYAEQHPDFICIAAANTIGTGADRMYSGRNKLDLSTMERFGIGKLFVDYDQHVEAALCPDEELREHLTRYRKAIAANRLERAMSTRFMAKAYKMMQLGWSRQQIDAKFFQGWREDEINKVKSFRD